MLTRPLKGADSPTNHVLLQGEMVVGPAKAIFADEISTGKWSGGIAGCVRGGEQVQVASLLELERLDRHLNSCML